MTSDVDNINIAMCFDDGYVLPSKIALYSLFKNNQKHSINIYIIHAGLSKDSQSELKKLTSFFDKKRIIFKKIDDTEIRKRFSKTLVLDYISIATYYRYLIAEVLPDIDKILYMDGDVLFNGDVSLIWDTKLTDCLFATVKDNWMMNEQKDHLLDIGFSEKDEFFVAGFMLMNLTKVRKDKIVEKLFEVTTSKQYQGKLRYQDQDALNITCKGKIKAIDSKCHYCAYDFYKDKHEFSGIISAHYNGAVKPWKNQEQNGTSDIYFLQLYNEYMDGLARLDDGRSDLEWRDLYENNVRQKVYIQSLIYDLTQKDTEPSRSMNKKVRRLAGNVKCRLKTIISRGVERE
jgi:lipopolysaccharide biosynthesis glycosyltransferase